MSMCDENMHVRNGKINGSTSFAIDNMYYVSFKSSTKLLSLDSTILIDELTAETFYHFKTFELFNI